MTLYYFFDCRIFFAIIFQTPCISVDITLIDWPFSIRDNTRLLVDPWSDINYIGIFEEQQTNIDENRTLRFISGILF